MLFGTERHILSLAKHSNKDEFEHWVSVPREGTFTEALSENKIKYVISGRLHGKKYPWQGFFETRGFTNLVKLIRSEKFDIVHTHLNTYGGFIAKYTGAKNIVHTRHGIFWTEEELKKISFAKRKFQSFKSGFFEITIALSELEKNVMVEYLGYSADRIIVIYNGVTISEIQSKLTRGVTKKSLFNTDKFVVGSVGRFERQKGFNLFLDSIADIVKQISDIKFVIIGKGSLKKKLEEQIIELGLSNYVELMDYQKNIFDYINNFDLFVSTSIWEGVPYAILEAMALGKPLIAFTSKLSGVKEMIENGKSGFLIENDYVNGLSSAISELYKNHESLKKISIGSKERIKERFSEQKMVNKTEDVYRGLFAKKNKSYTKATAE